MSYRPNNRAPVTWMALLRAVRCDVCGRLFVARIERGDRGTYPMRNRARGAAIRHVNEVHPNHEKEAES